MNNSSFNNKIFYPVEDMNEQKNMFEQLSDTCTCHLKCFSRVFRALVVSALLRKFSKQSQNIIYVYLSRTFLVFNFRIKWN